MSAVADIVDNSIAAGARRVDIELCFDGISSYVLIADDGRGLTNDELVEALRFGSRRDYGTSELGRYGLGLKTASLSQCRRLTVASRRAAQRRRIAARSLDLDHVLDTDRWEVIDPPEDTVAFHALEWLDHAPGTVVVWERLDRVLPEANPSGGWARRRLEVLTAQLGAHVAMVFHRFIEGSVPGHEALVVTINGQKLDAWDPFAPEEEFRVRLPRRIYEVWNGSLAGTVSLSPFVLPARSLFSTLTEFERLGGPARWNRQQGLYIYRAGRLIQSGGWSGIRAIDEHTKLGRAALDFSPELDELFQINVAKMRVQLPPEVRTLIEPHVGELCHRAEEMYRRDLREGAPAAAQAAPARISSATDIGAAIAARRARHRRGGRPGTHRGPLERSERPVGQQVGLVTGTSTPW